MNPSAQLQMFEPEGPKLAELVQLHNRTCEVETKRAENLSLAGFTSAAASRLAMAADAAEAAAVCEMTLQFESLAGLV